MTKKQEQYIDDLADELRHVVENIENSIKTTKNNYGKYGRALSYFSDGCPDKAMTLMLAFKRAGANMQGLRDGYSTFIKSN